MAIAREVFLAGAIAWGGKSFWLCDRLLKKCILFFGKPLYSVSHWYGIHLKPRPVKFLAVESVPH